MTSRRKPSEGRDSQPAAAPDVIPERRPPRPAVGDESEGSNAVQHHPDPRADDRPPSGPGGRAPRGAYPTGNS